MSGGEQQRIGFARVFLYRPDWLFLDEATSALDEDTEQALYSLLRERLPGLTLISVAHRAGVATFHRRRLTLRPETRSIEDGLCWPQATEAVMSARGNGDGGERPDELGGSKSTTAGVVPHPVACTLKSYCSSIRNS